MADEEYGPTPPRCADCGAALQEVHNKFAGRLRDIWRCPWATNDRQRVEFHDPFLLVINCDWPKGYVDKKGSPLAWRTTDR